MTNQITKKHFRLAFWKRKPKLEPSYELVDAEHVKKICPVCGKSFIVPFYRRETARFCSVACKSASRGGYILKEDEEVVERYSLGKFVSVVITRNKETGQSCYHQLYAPLSVEEEEVYRKTVKIYREEAPFNVEEDMLAVFKREFQRLAGKYGLKVSDESWEKILYYAGRDLLKRGYGILDGFMRDSNIEDIRCNGVGIPIFVWHIRYKYIRTNFIFKDETELDNYVSRLSQIAGKELSIAHPRVVALLPGHHRLSANYSREITRFGSAFQIRKFKNVALSIVDLIKRGTMTPRMASYFWLLMENRIPIMVIGATGAGKTTTLNALLSMLKPGTGIITVEETPELNLSHLNWISKNTRESYGTEGETGAIGLFELVEDALKQRPEVLVVGEVMGKEATVLFSAIATGHGGLCTFHAENINKAIQRLIGSDIGVSPQDIELMPVYVNLQQVELKEAKDYSTRRVLEVTELKTFDGKDLTGEQIFRWEASNDTFEDHPEKSFLLPRIAKASGKTVAELFSEMDRRASFLQGLAEKDIRTYEAVSKAIEIYLESKT